MQIRGASYLIEAPLSDRNVRKSLSCNFYQEALNVAWFTKEEMTFQVAEENTVKFVILSVSCLCVCLGGVGGEGSMMTEGTVQCPSQGM